MQDYLIKDSTKKIKKESMESSALLNTLEKNFLLNNNLNSMSNITNISDTRDKINSKINLSKENISSSFKSRKDDFFQNFNKEFRAININSRNETSTNIQNNTGNNSQANILFNNMNHQNNSSNSLPSNTHHSSKFEKLSNLMGSSDELNILKCKILSNANVIKEYENWIHLLLNVINSAEKENDYFDVATPVDMNIKKMESLGQDNLEINKKIVREIQKNMNKETELITLQKDLEILQREALSCSNNDCTNADKKNYQNSKLEQEKYQIAQSINSVSLEVEDLKNQNKLLEEEVEREKLNDIQQMWLEFKRLKQENKALNNVLILENSFKQRKNLANHNNNSEIFKNTKINDINSPLYDEDSDVVLFSYRKNKDKNFFSSKFNEYEQCHTERKKDYK